MNLKTLKAAFPLTIPVMTGYLTLGTAFGLLLHTAGYGPLWALAMSIFIYAGSAQILGVSLLAAGTPPLEAAVLTFILNLRHLVYGLSMLEKYRGMGKRKLYMIFSLTDETYALLSSAVPPPDVDEHDFYFTVSLLDQSYWVLGSLLGALVGTAIRFSTEGADFAMTAMFLVIAVSQWKSAGSHLPALLGAAAAIGGLLIAGRENMLVPALAVIVIGLVLLRPKLEPGTERKEES